MRDVLAFKGYRLAEAETGEEGVRLAGELHPDLILMDIQLPGINGIAAFRKIREDPATETIPVMAVTASAMTQDRQKIMAAGFEGYQSKPLNVKAFVEAVRQMLDKRSRALESDPTIQEAELTVSALLPNHRPTS